MGVGSTILAGVLGVAQVLGSAGSDILGGITAATGAINTVISGTEAGSATTIGGAILTLANTVGTTFEGIYDDLVLPVENVIGSVDKFDKQITTKFVGPIESVITDYEAITKSLHEGLTGILQVPKELSDALTTVGGMAQAAAKTTIAGQKAISESLITEGFKGHIGDPLTAIHDLYSKYQGAPSVNLDDIGVDSLQPEQNITGIYTKYATYKDNLKTDGSWYDKVALAILSLINSVPAALGYYDHAKAQINQALNTDVPIGKLSPADVVKALIRGEISDSDAQAEVLAQSIDPSRLQLLHNISMQLMGARDMIIAYYRNIVTYDEMVEELEHLGYDESRIKLLVSLFVYLPNPEDSMKWFARAGLAESDLDMILAQNGFDTTQIQAFKASSMLPVNPASFIRALPKMLVRDKGFLQLSLSQVAPENVGQYYLQNLVAPEQADIDWLNHWRLLGVGDWISAYFRGLITDEDLTYGLESLAVPPELNDTMIGLERELIPIWLIPEILSSGLIDDEAATKMLSKLGIDKDNTDIILKYGRAKANTGIKGMTDALQQLSLTNLKDMFEQGIIDDGQYLIGLQDHGYVTEAAALMVKLMQQKAEIKNRKDTAEGIVDRVAVGLLTPEDAVTKLYSLGFTDNEVSKYLDKIKAVRVANSKTPTLAELKDMLLANIITPQVWAESMTQIGYSQQWTDAFYQLYTGQKV